MSDDYSVYDDLMYKWKRETSTVDILKLFKQCSKGKKVGENYPEEYWLMYLSVLSEKRKMVSFNRMLKQYIRAYGVSKLINYLCISVRLNKKINKKRDRHRFIYNWIRGAPIEKEIKKMMTGKTVAIVGNSDCEMGKGKGKEIDGHDIVIRFNDYQLSKYCEDYGTKTNIWVRNLEDYLDEKPFEKYDLIVYSADLLHFPLRDRILDSIEEAAINGCKVTSFESKSYVFLKEKGLLWPTSGASIIATIYQVFGNLNSVDFYGFSFLEDNPSFYHYFDTKEKNEEFRKKILSDHDPNKESRVLKELGCH